MIPIYSREGQGLPRVTRWENGCSRIWTQTTYCLSSRTETLHQESEDVLGWTVLCSHNYSTASWVFSSMKNISIPHLFNKKKVIKIYFQRATYLIRYLFFKNFSREVCSRLNALEKQRMFLVSSGFQVAPGTASIQGSLSKWMKEEKRKEERDRSKEKGRWGREFLRSASCKYCHRTPQGTQTS